MHRFLFSAPSRFTLLTLTISLACPALARQSRDIGGAGPATPDGPLQKAQNRVSGRVWHDANRDGLAQAGESAVKGVHIQLLDAYGKETGVATVTNASGQYVLSGMADGAYRVAFVRPDGWEFTHSEVGSKTGGGQVVRAGDFADDSDLNRSNGYTDPTRRGPYETGLSFHELTRFDELGKPWPINVLSVYPAVEGSNAGPRLRVRDIYLDAAADMANNVATSKLATASIGGDPNEVSTADPEAIVHDLEARLDAPLSPDGPFPVVLVFSGLLGGIADMAEIGDYLASHGFIALCAETCAFHASLALGGRLSVNGGPYVQSDFDHIPQVAGSDLSTLLSYGYQVAGYLTGTWNGPGSEKLVLMRLDSDFILDQAEAWNSDGGHPFHAQLQLERVGWYGYSAGAAYATSAVNTDSRIAFLINADSSQFTNVPKPMLWVGNHTTAQTQGPSVMARLTSDFHPHYFFIPAITFEPAAAANRYHREYHHEFRNTLITAFSGYYLKGVLDYRENLGFEGLSPRFDGYVTPYLTAKIAGWHSEAISLVGNVTRSIDAGLVDVRLWALENNELTALSTEFLPDQPLSQAARDFYGPIFVDKNGNRQPLAEAAVGLALDTQQQAAFLIETGPELLRLDLGAIAAGAPVLAESLGTVTNLSTPVHALTYEPKTSRLLAIAGSPAHLYSFAFSGAPNATDLGVLPPSVTAPAGLCFDARERAWVSDSSAGLLQRLAPATMQPLEQAALAPGVPASVTFDGVEKLTLVVDRASGELWSVQPETGATFSHGPLAGGGFGPEVTLACQPTFADRNVSAFQGKIGASTGAGEPLLRDVIWETPNAGWDGALLRVQISEGTGLRSDVLFLAATSTIALGARQSVNFPQALMSEAQEVLWKGTRVAWLETDWDLAFGGLRLAPLRILLTSEATSDAVADVLEALCYTGPLPRRVEVKLTLANGNAGRAEVIELVD